MNWKKVTKLLILIFSCINIGLFLYNSYIINSRYTLSAEDKAVLQEVIEENGINIYAPLPEFKPMPKLKLKESSFDKMKFANKIRDKEVNFPYVEGISTYTNDITGESITFLDNENKIIYENQQAKEDIVNSYDEATKMAKEFAKWFLDEEIQLELTEQKEVNENVYNYTFVEVFKEKYKIYSNNLTIRITKKGVERAEFKRLLPIDLESQKWEITPVDDVLYNVLNYIRRDTPDKNIIIVAVDIGYRFDFSLMGDERTANPYYFIYYKIDNKEGRGVEDRVLYIDAYDNQFIPEN